MASQQYVCSCGNRLSASIPPGLYHCPHCRKKFMVQQDGSVTPVNNLPASAEYDDGKCAKCGKLIRTFVSKRGNTYSCDYCGKKFVAGQQAGIFNPPSSSPPQQGTVILANGQEHIQDATERKRWFNSKLSEDRVVCGCKWCIEFRYRGGEWTKCVRRPQ